MEFNVFTLVLSVALIQLSQAIPLRLQKRAAFYIANETACVVDNLVYLNGDPIPTDDPCEACKCRPPGFACVLKDCPKKPGCRAVRRSGECCPEYVCGEDNASTTIISLHNEEPAYDTTSTYSQTESKVEYVEPEDNTSSESPEEKSVEIETRTHIEPSHTPTADISEVIHRISITVQEVETTKSETTTTSETTKSEATTSQSVEEFTSDESSSPIDVLDEELSNGDEQIENEANLLKTDLDLNDSESNKAEEFSSKENILTSTTISDPESNSELYVTTESQLKDELVPTSEITEAHIQINFPDVTETPLLVIEEIEKETNEIKRFRSLNNNNSTEDSSETENADVKNDTDNKTISNESVNAEIKDLLESIESKIKILSEIEDQKNTTEKATETTEISTLSHIPEDKIAEFLISLKKTTPNVPTTDELVRDSFLTTLSSYSERLENTSETKVKSVPLDSVTPVVKEQTITEEGQQTSNTVTIKDVEHNLGRAFSDLLDSSDAPEHSIIKTETSTSQVDDIVDLSTHKTTVSISLETLATEQEQNAVSESHNTESETENFTITENNKNFTTLEKEIVVSA